MKTDEFKAVLRRFRRTITSLEHLIKRTPECCDHGRSYIRELNQLWSDLDDHRLEMEEAEAKPAQTLDDVAHGVLRHSGLAIEVDDSGRLDAIEERLSKIERATGLRDD